ncbi:EAL domain-containing protein [Desulfuromonas acetoxidans]|nr:EAL domain-containing protein [Desulfuromonas acetoxidans]MBF0647068.1 EAL domain-containing protein [Desulfuromonas acetoxidans]NVD24922.1 EAL domain-containing protein [Desulfuromonas acetoxidans]NVE15223.1 EAL domain-containing protein [Desulfuromonas acetoxidans]
MLPDPHFYKVTHNTMDGGDLQLENNTLHQQLEQLKQEQERLLQLEQDVIGYVRAKIDQLLKIMGTLPLRQEELDDATLLALDPIGIIAESFSQVLDHLKETNNDLVVARDELEAIFNATGAAIIVLNDELQLHSCNPMAVKRFSIDAEKALGCHLEQAIPDCHSLLSQNFLNELANCRQGRLVIEIAFHDSWYSLVATPVRNSNDQVSFYALIFSDITERKRTEESLVEAETRLTEILNTMMAGILIIDPQTHRIVDVNHMASQMIGDPPDKIIGAICHRYICPSSSGQCPLTDLNQVIDNSDRVLINNRGEEIPILKTATIIELNGKAFILESFIDIQARKLAEQALRESEQRYRSLYTAMREGVAIGELVYDAHGVACDYILHDVNRAFSEMLGVASEELVGHRASEFYHGAPPYIHILDEVVKYGIPKEYELPLSDLEKVFHVSVSRPEKERFACIINDVTDSKKAQQEIERLAYYDTLTGLPNRVLIKDRLQQAVAQAQRSRALVGVLALDLDHFKKINDSLGIGCGDQMLKLVSQRLKGHLRQGDSVARMGGDEFVILITGIKSQNDIVTAAGKILDLLAEPVTIDGHDLVSTGSLGISVYPTDADEVDLLLKHADTAMYQAKETGRNLYQFYSPDMNERAFERLFLDSDLHRALARNELELYFQPQIDLAQGHVVGAEALLRWNHATKGQISPVVFIPLAEESDLILDIGGWVIEEACRHARQWHDQGYTDLRVAVNLSARQFRSDLPDIVARVLHETGLPAHLLELELTESLLMERPELARTILNKLRYLGNHLSIDDFGTGYSSLSYLKHFPIDRLKIDRSFVKDLNVDPDDAIIVEAIIALAHGLRLNVVAEGVETSDQFEFMRQRGCDEIQGYVVARPMPADDFLRYLQKSKRQTES